MPAIRKYLRFIARLSIIAAGLLLTVPATAQERGVIGVLEINPGTAWGEHVSLQGLVNQVSHPGFPSPGLSFHSTAVSSRIFQDNGLADSPIDGSWASREAWQIWSYQALSRDRFRQALDDLGPVARIINHSAGYTFSSTGTNQREIDLDRMIYRHRNLFTQAAHNEGPSERTLREPAGSYNALVIGSTGTYEAAPDSNPFRGWAENAYIAGYSSRGPTSDGRHKPDFVAPGANLVLATYDPANTSAVVTTSGTSFAAPYVAGVAAHLLEEADLRGWDSDPLVLKSVLLNSAQEVHQELNWQSKELMPETWDGWSPTNTANPLDIDQGAGEISTPRAEWQYFTNAEQEPESTVARIGWDHGENLVADERAWYYFSRPAHAGATLTATLNWMREFTVTDAVIELANLDLELWETDGRSPISQVTQSDSVRDNVEHIHRFDLPSDGFYALSVNFVDGATASLGLDYGLAWLLPDSTFLPGDANLDGWVDLIDFSIWKSHEGSGTLLSQGDFDLDGDVDFDDYSSMLANFGSYQPLAEVPEPAAWQYLLALVLCGVLASTRHYWPIRRVR